MHKRGGSLKIPFILCSYFLDASKFKVTSFNLSGVRTSIICNLIVFIAFTLMEFELGQLTKHLKSHNKFRFEVYPLGTIFSCVSFTQMETKLSETN